MKKQLTDFIVGLLFGMGLILSGMTDPGKVIGFLDILGHWDPSLSLVMAGAIGVGLFAFAMAKKRTTSLWGDELRWPRLDQIDLPLIMGALLFGAGWGLAGFCPGPAIVSMASGQVKSLVFVVFMVLGMLMFEGYDRVLRKKII